MNIQQKLLKVQSELKAPKNQFNAFGKYKYRSCEDILEALKPILLEHELTLTISDEMIVLGDRFYLKANAVISDGSEKIINSAFAREPEDKKGADASQITGMASSYARKYALNGLFLIDDTKDADTMDNSEQPKAKREEKQEEQPFRLDPKIIEQFNAVDSVEGLKAVWDSLGADKRKFYTKVKDNVKNKLMGEAA